jgi:hypothetical protein
MMAKEQQKFETELRCQNFFYSSLKTFHHQPENQPQSCEKEEKVRTAEVSLNLTENLFSHLSSAPKKKQKEKNIHSGIFICVQHQRNGHEEFLFYLCAPPP